MNKPTLTNVIVVIGAGSIGQAIARRVSAGKQILLADSRQENADATAKTLIDAGFKVSTTKVDVSSRASVQALIEKAKSLGEVSGVIHAAGVSPSQASPEAILKVDLYGTALVLEEFGNVIARGGSGVVIASQSGHRLPPLSTEQNVALATTPVEELLKLPMLQPDQVKDPLHAYQLSKRGNSLQVMAEAVRWGKRGARVNTISPGIIITPLANDELNGPRGAGYRRMIDLCPAGRAGTPDEVGTVGALLMGADGAFITGSDFLMDGWSNGCLLVRRTRSEVRLCLLGPPATPQRRPAAKGAWLDSGWEIWGSSFDDCPRRDLAIGFAKPVEHEATFLSRFKNCISNFCSTQIMKRNCRRFRSLLFMGLMVSVMQPGSAVVQAAVTVESNLVYGAALDYTGSNVTLMLDAYYVNSAQTNRPVVILTHGGGFGAGDKGYTVAQGNFYPDMATAFANSNFVAFSINYRLWPGCPGGCPDEIAMAVEDVMTALGWIRTNSAHYGVDATRVLIAGDSAGGGLAVNASYAPTNVNSFLGCISLWGGVPPYGTNVHPVNNYPVTSQTPPTCLIHGTADVIVPYAVSVNLSSNLNAAGVYNELHPLVGYNHYPVMSTNGYDTNLVSTILNYMIPFAKRTTSGLQSAAPVRLGSHLLQAANGQFSFDITGPTNVTVAVEQSSDEMSSWLVIATNQLVTGSSFVTNAISTTNEFYRARIISQ